MPGKLLRRAKLEDSFLTFSELANIADAKLFFSILHNPKHVLYQLLPPLHTNSIHQLRPREYNDILPPKDNSQFIDYVFWRGLCCFRIHQPSFLVARAEGVQI